MIVVVVCYIVEIIIGIVVTNNNCLGVILSTFFLPSLLHYGFTHHLFVKDGSLIYPRIFAIFMFVSFGVVDSFRRFSLSFFFLHPLFFYDIGFCGCWDAVGWIIIYLFHAFIYLQQSYLEIANKSVHSTIVDRWEKKRREKKIARVHSVSSGIFY